MKSHQTSKQIGSGSTITINNGTISSTVDITLSPTGDLILSPGGDIEFTSAGDGYILANDGDIELAVQGVHQIKLHNKTSFIGTNKTVSVANGIVDVGTGDVRFNGTDLRSSMLIDMMVNNWTMVNYQTAEDFECIYFSPANQWYSVCGSSDFWAASVDGAVWLADTNPPNNSIPFFVTAHDNAVPGRVLVAGYGSGLPITGYRSDDLGHSWTAVTGFGVTDPSLRPTGLDHNWLAPGSGGVWCMSGYGGVLKYSSDGNTFSNCTHSLGTATLWFVKHSHDSGHNQWLAGGSSGILARSTDGINWTTCTTGVSATLYDAAWNGTAWIVCGSSGCILYSTDGATWTDKTISSTQPPASGLGAFNTVCVGPDNIFLVHSHMSKDNGVTWTRISMAAIGLNCLEYGNNRFVGACDDGQFALSLSIPLE